LEQLTPFIFEPQRGIRQQTNPYDPKAWESVLRYDGYGSDPHWNKVLGQDVFAPHIHDPYCPGGVRPAFSWEIPH
jgi:hypothetical protein